MEQRNIWNMLEDAAKCPLKNGIVFFSEGPDVHDQTEYRHQYCQLHKDARQRSLLLGNILKRQKIHKLESNRIVLLHFDNHLESINWFWAVVAAGCIPCLSLPFKSTYNERQKYIENLQKLFQDPLIITTNALKPLFPDRKLMSLRLRTTEELENRDRGPQQDFGFPGATKTPDDLAVIMLTSGSTGQPKAVGLKHGQILRSVEGKTRMHKTTSKDNFLNWTDFSHVANLVEIHLHAVSLVAIQIQVSSADIITNPVKFLELIDKYRVSYTFAPNFLLAALLKSLEASKRLDIDEDWVDRCAGMGLPEVPDVLSMNDNQRTRQLAGTAQSKTLHDGDIYTERKFNLKCLRALISGGESNVVETCHRLTKMLRVYGTPDSFIRPGFGMTETCAGCIYGLDCPQYDLDQKSEFASLGEPIADAKMRVVDDFDVNVKEGEIGVLQLSGLAVFDGYYNNKEATKECFTDDGWFKTGDVARIDKLGRLHIVGRVKDTILINGVNHYPHAIEAALEEANIDGMKSTFTAVFPYRPRCSATEHMCVVYVPTYDIQDIKSRVDTLIAISKAVVLYSGVRPYKVIPLGEELLRKSTLGKLSRSSIRDAFEKNEYQKYLEEDMKFIQQHQRATCSSPTTRTEQIIMKTYHDLFFISLADIGGDSNLFELGISSIDLLKLHVGLQKELRVDLPITIFFAHTTIKDLAGALDTLPSSLTYDPIVILQPNGNRTPIFFIHPGMGEVLIFMNLARHITDRPVYALRARGFDREPYFSSMNEIITDYHAAIKRIQPTGPYALAGYSFGSILTFEIAKRMEKEGDEVKFLATFDQPPHFKNRARTYDWYECVLSVGFFLGLIPEDYAYAEMDEMRKRTHDDLLCHILTLAPAARVEELGMTTFRLDNWAKLALQMKKIAWDYDPEGMVPQMDIFYTVPLIGIVKAETTEEWRNDYIGKWSEFVLEPTYHFVGGGHRTLINPPHLVAFQNLFKRVLEERGL